MTREEISLGISNISNEYIQEAAYYRLPKMPYWVLSIKKVRSFFSKDKNLWLKLSMATIGIAVVLGGTFGMIVKKTELPEIQETAYKPAIMYENELFLLSSSKPDSFEVNKRKMDCVGIISETVSGKEFPTNNFQASGNSDVVGCNVYFTAKYPKCLFIWDVNDKLLVYELCNEDY